MSYDKIFREIRESLIRVQTAASRHLEAHYGADRITNVEFIRIDRSPRPRAPLTWEVEGSVEIKRRFFGKQLRSFKFLIDFSTGKVITLEI